MRTNKVKHARAASNSPRLAASPDTHRRKVSQLTERLLEWFSVHARDLPWRHTRDPYAIWISEIMLQQTQVKTVIPYWNRWLQQLPTVQSLAQEKTEKVLKLWEGLGYYTRARNLQKAAQIVVDRHQGVFPVNFDDVLALPGIGPYTAGAVCSIAFNQPAPILDGNVIRVLTRVFSISDDARDPSTREHLWSLAGQLVSRAHRIEHGRKKTSANPSAGNACSHLNQSLMELGALICAPRQPQCGHCPVQRLCSARADGTTASLPNLGPSVRPTHRRFVAVAVKHRNRYLVRQRPDGVVNARLWEFPNFESTETNPEKLLANAREQLGLELRSWEPLTVIKHSITRYRISLDVFRAALEKSPVRGDTTARWLPRDSMAALPFTGAHRKITRLI